MAYVEPNSNVDFFYNTGLSMSHENTLYFSSASAKDQYFTDWNKVSVDHVTYQRENRGFVRVELPMSRLYNVDYMRFRNVSFENHNFYAFVVAVNYINNVTTEIQYVLDPVMTWMGIFSLKQCYIERQHTTNDGIGNNIADEGLPTGGYIVEHNTQIGNYSASSVIRIAHSVPIASSIGGIYNAVSTIDCSTASEAQSTINQLINNNEADGIVQVMIIPQTLANSSGVSKTTVSIAKPYDDFSGYVPRNKKLFTYPFKYCTMDNQEGATVDMRYEYFDTVPDATSSGNMQFQLIGIAYPTTAEIDIEPLNYAENGWNEKKLNITHFPICAWSVNSYQAYLAQKNAYYPLDMTTGVINAGLGGAYSGIGQQTSQALAGNAGGVLGGVGTTIAGTALAMGKSALGTVLNNIAINTIKPETPNTLHGTPGGDLRYSNGRMGFMLYQKCITKNYAMMIDNYFDMYGYAIKQHGTPNMDVRPHWTYVKTAGCDVSGNLPAEDKRQIEDIFDNGVRFWHNLLEMGNYSLDNSPS